LAETHWSVAVMYRAGRESANRWVERGLGTG